MEKFKKILSKIKYYRVICIVISLVALIIGTVMRLSVSYGSQKYLDQTAAQRWDKKGRYSHVSIFIKESALFTSVELDGLIFDLENALDEKLPEAKKDEEEKSSLFANKDDKKNDSQAQRYIYSYMAKSFISLESDKKVVNVDCMAVGGDFFFFHPVKLVSGTYFSSEDLMHDGVILDEATAWQLFGSTDVEGQKVLYGDRVLFVKGVYKPEEGKIFEYARGKDPLIFVPFELLDSNDFRLNISSVEFLMLNPIDNFSSKLISETVSIGDNMYEIVDNSKRFNADELWRTNKDRKYRTLQNHDMIYPYWEKVARFEEDILAPKAVWMYVSYIISGGVFISLLVYELAKLTRLKQRNDD